MHFYIAFLAASAFHFFNVTLSLSLSILIHLLAWLVSDDPGTGQRNSVGGPTSNSGAATQISWHHGRYAILEEEGFKIKEMFLNKNKLQFCDF